MNKIAAFFWRTRTGRILLVVGAAMGVAYGLRVALVDLPAMRAKEAARIGAATLEEMGERLADALDTAEDKPLDLPTLTEWYPANVPCAADAPLPMPREAVWDVLGLPADDSRTKFQYRFQKNGAGYEIRARRDSDCDGLYAVWLLSMSSSGVLGREVTAQNIQE